MFSTIKNVFGLALVLAATSGIAFAQTASTGGTTSGVPEIDPSAIGSALTLLCGGVLMITDKIRR